jgi:small subunit ribosomal protein S4e
MGKKGGSKHLKRKPAPIFWPIHRKENRWIVKPRAGPHKSTESIPLLVVLRDMLSIGKTRREVDFLLSRGNVMVDGVIRKDDDFPAGLMDIVEIPSLNKVYRILPIRGKGLRLHQVPNEERQFKLCKVMGKTTVKKGNVQLNLSDGRNILIKVADPKRPSEDIYKTSDLIRLSIPNAEILDHIPFEQGVLAIIDSGENVGQWGEVTKITESNIYGSTVTIRNSENQEVETVADYVFPIGKGEAWISLPRGEEP